MLTKIIKISSAAFLSLFILASILIGTAVHLIPDRQAFHVGDTPDNNFFVTIEGFQALPTIANCGKIKSERAQAKLFGFLPIKEVSIDYYDDLSLYVGGFPFGVKFYTDGIIVVELSDVNTENGSINPAYEAGIRTNDVIIKCNGESINEASKLTKIIENSGGNAIELTYRRGENEHSATVTPVISKDDGLYKTGMWIKDSGAGIGTVTYVSPEDNSFGGLGHGICDSTTGELVPMERGNLMDVTLSGVEKGLVGDPGEIKGYFGGNKLGSVLKNTNCGVFGFYADIPKEANKLLPIGLRGEIENGKAVLVCTLDDNGATEYEIELSGINQSASPQSNKCFTVKITDPKLIEKTGGIIQGMSGSPILQNGKIVGAVTHVFVNDPTKGYGIFIENMISEAEKD